MALRDTTYRADRQCDSNKPNDNMTVIKQKVRKRTRRNRYGTFIRNM